MSEKPKLRKIDSSEMIEITQQDVNAKLALSEYALQQKYEKFQELFNDRMEWEQAKKNGATERDFSFNPMKKTMP